MCPGYRRDMTDSDLGHLRSARALSRRSRERGNQPFGALLTGPDGQVLLEAEDTVVTGPDCTGHAVTNLMRLASRQFTSDFLALQPVCQHRALPHVRRRHILGRRRTGGVRIE